MKYWIDGCLVTVAWCALVLVLLKQKDKIISTKQYSSDSETAATKLYNAMLYLTDLSIKWHRRTIVQLIIIWWTSNGYFLNPCVSGNLFFNRFTSGRFLCTNQVLMSNKYFQTLVSTYVMSFFLHDANLRYVAY